MFNTLGIINAGKAVLGALEYKGRPLLVAVSLAEGTDQEKAGIFKDVTAKLNSPDVFSSKTTESYLKQNFSSSAEPVLKVSLSSMDMAAVTVENVLSQTDCKKIIFLCHDRNTYLTTCSELGMSRRDFFHFAEIKEFLHERETQSVTVIGRTRKLIEQLESGLVPLAGAADNLSYAEHTELLRYLAPTIPHTIQSIKDSAKFVLENTDAATVHDDLMYPADYRLPFDKCLFEYDYTSILPNGDPIKIPAIMLVHSMENRYIGQIFCKFPNGQTLKINDYYDCLFAGPTWTVDERGRIENAEPCAIHPLMEKSLGTENIFRMTFGPLTRILPTLAALNSPRAIIDVVSPPPKLQKKALTNGRIPFFDYHEVKLEDLKGPRNEILRGNAVEGREGTALHKVRGHERTYKSGESTWVNWHYRGDPAFGVIHKSISDFSKEKGPE